MAYALERKILFFFITLLAGVFMFAFVSSVSAATTIGNNVSVGGTLTVTGVTTVSSNVLPNANKTIDLGAFGTAFNDVFVSGTVWVSESIRVAGALIVGDDVSIEGGITLVANSDGQAGFADDLTLYGSAAGGDNHNTYDIGVFGNAWKDVFASGTLYAATSTIFNTTGTSTVYLSSGVTNTGGRIILEDSDGAGCTEIYALNGDIVTSTVTCP